MKKAISTNIFHRSLLAILFSIFALFLTGNAWSNSIKLPHDGKLRLYVYHTNEVMEFNYKPNGVWDEAVFANLSRLLRSREDGLEIKMDKRLIELADHLQDHFKIDTVEVISGYRSKSFNKALKDSGRNVANESYHTKGMALDIHIDELREATIRDYLLSLKLGGVGYYGNVNMVHMDFGPIRQWTGGEFKNNTEIGIFNKESDIKLRTDKWFYKPGGTVQLTINQTEMPVTFVVEKFHRGLFQPAVIWTDFTGRLFKKGSQKISLQEIANKIKGFSAFGKFRFVLKTQGDWQNSNEFYIKKK